MKRNWRVWRNTAAQYGRLTKKTLTTPVVAKPKQGDAAVREGDEARDSVAEAA